jgi:hypothetical protein
MMHPNLLENDSIMAPVAQEAGIIELSLEELEGIQGGGGILRVLRFLAFVVNKVFGNDDSSSASEPIEDSWINPDYSTGGA